MVREDGMSEQDGLENPRRRLGRGLSALLGGSAPAHEEVAPQDNSELRHVPTSGITRNPFQPRKDFDAESLNELADSVKEHGVLQPILVRAVDGGFQLIAGERRWLAAQKAGLTTIPCRIVDVIDQTAFEFALEENLKRRDLHDIEKAEAFREYLRHFQCSIEDLAKQLSMSRSSVSNILRLLDLVDPVKNAVRSGKISSGHARSLLSLSEADQLALCGRIQAESLNVRQTEAAVKAILKPQAAEQAVVEVVAAPVEGAEVAAPVAVEGESAPAVVAETSQPVETIPFRDAAQSEGGHRTPHIDSVEEQLRQLLGVEVQIKLKSPESGFIVIPFNSNDDFEKVLRTVRRNAA
jgi:ParB family chromosome partitioning protein